MSWGECSHGNPAQCRHEAGPHSKLTPEELGKWMNIANQNALEREAWAERYDRLHVALCQACELLNRGDSVTAHNIIRERLDAEYVEAKENAPTLNGFDLRMFSRSGQCTKKGV